MLRLLFWDEIVPSDEGPVSQGILGICQPCIEKPCRQKRVINRKLNTEKLPYNGQPRGTKNWTLERSVHQTSFRVKYKLEGIK